MKTSTKIALITAITLILIGASLVFTAFYKVDFDYNRFMAINYDIVNVTLTEDFDRIDLNEFSDIEIMYMQSTNDECTITYPIIDNITRKYEVENGTLTSKFTDNREWHDHIGIYWVTPPKVIVSLPKETYTYINVKTTSGDINIRDNITFEYSTLETSSGDIRYEFQNLTRTTLTSQSGDILLQSTRRDVSAFLKRTGIVDINTQSGDAICNNSSIEALYINTESGDAHVYRVRTSLAVNVTTKSGDMELYDLISANSINLNSTSGDISFHPIDVNENGLIDISTVSGDVNGHILTEKCFTAATTSGDIDVPPNYNGNATPCYITTTSGDIKILVE